MVMSQQGQVRLLSMVDVLGPLSPEELEDLAKRTPDTYLEKATSSTPPARCRGYGEAVHPQEGEGVSLPYRTRGG